MDAPATARTLTLVFTDLVNSTALKSTHGDEPAAELIARHRAKVIALASDTNGRIVDWAGDGCFLTFETPSAAVLFTLRLQQAHAQASDLPRIRIGIHTGEVTERNSASGPALRVEGLAVDIAARLQALAQPNQVLMSSFVFDNVRQRLLGQDLGAAIAWRAHGLYELKGIDDAIQVCEAGIEGVSPLSPPMGSDKAHRAVTPGDEDTLGWRPAAGLTIPRRDNWNLQSMLGEGGFGEVWLAVHAKTKDKRVFKFCFEPERVRGLKREVVLFRLLKESLGNRDDIAQILDWDFEHAPFFIESEYTEGGDLKSWAASNGGLSAIPIETRLELVAQTAVAMGAAHSVGVLHKDLKPGNILVSNVAGKKEPRVSLTDFGIGLIMDPTALAARGITSAGLTETLISSSTPSSGAGTRLYMAPELIEGKAATTLSDVYALGIVLYQMVVGDFGHALAPGWERDVADPLLVQDIAACVDGNPERRLPGAADLATRLRSLDKRRTELEAEARLRVAMEKAHRRRQQFTAVTIAGAVLTIVVAAFAYRENQRANTQAEYATSERQLRVEADTARDEANAARAAEASLRDQAEHNAYVVAINAADKALTTDSDTETRERLARLPAERRDWEWGYLVNKAFPEKFETVSVAAPVSARSSAEYWSKATPQLVARLSGHDSNFVALRFLPDGSRIATRGGSDGLLWWDAKTFAKITTSGAVDNFTSLIQFQPDFDSRWIALQSNLEIKIIDVAKDELVAGLHGLGESFLGIPYFSRDGSVVVARDASQRIIAWDWRTDRILWNRQLPPSYSAGSWMVAECIGFPENASQVYLATDHTGVDVVDIRSGNTIRTIAMEVPAGFIPCDISTNGHRIAYFDPVQKAYLVADISSGKPLGPPWIDGLGFEPYGVKLSPDGTVAVVSTNSNVLRVLFPEDSAAVPVTINLPDPPDFGGPQFSPDGRMIGIATNRGIVAIFAPEKTDNTMQENPFQYVDGVSLLNFLDSDDRLGAAGYDGIIRVLDLNHNKVISTLKAHNEGITLFSVSPDGSRWLTHGYDGIFALWDAQTGKQLYISPTGVSGNYAGGTRAPLIRIILPSRTNASFTSDGSEFVVADQPTGVITVDAKSLVARQRLTEKGNVWNYGEGYSPDGKLVYAFGQYPIAYVWDTDTGALRVRAETPAGNIVSVTFSPDSKHVFVASESGMVAVYNCGTGEKVHEWRANKGATMTMRFDPRGNNLLMASTDGTASLWDANTYELRARFTGHTAFVTDARFSPDGNRLFTISFDSSLRVWDLLGNELVSIEYEKENITMAAWSPSGNRIAVATVEGNIHIYDSIPPGELDQQPGQSLGDAVSAWRVKNRATE